MDILLQPDALSLVGSMSNFVIYSESDVVFIIKDHDSNRVIVQHTYNPSDTNRVEVNVKDIIQPLLTFDMRDSSVAWQQTSIIKKFDVTVYDVVKEGVSQTTKNVSFDIIRAGVDNFADSAENFLTQNFLTWQPNMKAVTYYSPEYLTYYAVVAAVVKCKTYIKGQEATIALADIAAGTCWTIPVTYSVIAGLAKDLPEYYDIWVENAQGSRLTYIQRYYAADIKSEDEEWFLFENSLGGVDSFRAYGDNQMTAEHTHNIAEIEDESEEYRVDTNRKHKKSTGFIGKKERLWLLDFFPSLAKYVYVGSALRRITVTESDASYTSSDTPSSYTFTYKLSDTNPYLNLPRTDIPQGAMDIKVPDVGSFTIAPRLVEFPRQTLSSGALFPVQNPYSENWAVTTAAALFTFIVSQLEANYANNGRIGHTHPNIDILNGLSILEGYLLSDGNKIKASFADDVAEASATLKKFLRNDKDGEVNGVIDFKQGLKIVGKAIAAIITSKDATAAADTNIYSALKACATFLRKDQEDSTEFLVKLLGGIITDSIKSKDFMQGLLGSGFAMFFDENNKSYLQVDKLVVTAKAIFASLELRKLSFVGGNFIFSASGATLTKVEEISTGWRCYIHTDDGTTATANMWAVGDMAKCQTFNIKPGVYDNVSNRYWWRHVDAVGDNYIDISATDHDTSVANDAPQVGDVLVQQGNKTDPTRQNMIAIMTVGEEAPAIIQYIGINDYDLNSHRRITLSPKGNKIIADSYIVEIDGKQETLATAAALKVLSDSITTSVSSIQKDIASKLNSKGTWVPGSYQANNLVTFNNQMFVALIDNSDCPIVPLTDENGDYLVDENNNIIVPTDENGHVTYSSSWKPYSSNEGVEDNIKNLKTDTSATFKIMSDKIDSKVASTTFDELGKTVDEHSTAIEQFPESISASITNSVKEGGTVYKAIATSFTMNDDGISLFGKSLTFNGTAIYRNIQSKAHTFTSQPTDADAYNVGDLWLSATCGSYKNDILKCITAKAAGATFDIAHWALASKYTDDSKAQDALDYRETFAKNLGYASLADMESKAKDDAYGTIIDGAYIRAKYLDVDTILVNALKGKKIDAQDGTIENLKLNNVIVNGSSKSPFGENDDSFLQGKTDNIALFNDQSSSSYAGYNIPNDVSQNGRILTITNYKYTDAGTVKESIGPVLISLATAGYVYENGNGFTGVALHKGEYVKLLGYGNSTTFFGWIVISRGNINQSDISYGRSWKVLAQGKVTGTSSTVSIYARTYNNASNFTIVRNSVGYYTVTCPSYIKITNINEVLVMATGIGESYGDPVGTYSPIKVSVRNVSLVNGNLTIEFMVSDDATPNDGNFGFTITNMLDWVS